MYCLHFAVDTQQGTKSTIGASNFSRNVPSSDAPRQRVRHRESALQKRMMASHAPHRIKRANSTPNLADDDYKHIYEELIEPLLDGEASTPTPQKETGRRGSDASKSDKRPGVVAPQKHTGRPDATQKYPRRPDNARENAGRSNVDKAATSRKNSVDMVGDSGDFPPSPPPRPVPDWVAAVPGKSPIGPGSNPTVVKMGGKINENIGRDAKSAVIEMKISPGIGIVSIASVSSSTSSAAEVPVKLSSFTGPFNDGAGNVGVTPPSCLSYDAGRAREDGSSRGLSASSSQINRVRMQVSEIGPGRDIPMPRYPGNTGPTMAVEDSGNKETFASRNNKFGVMVTENGRALRPSGNNGLSMDMEGPENKATPVSKASNDQGGKSEFRSPQNHLERQRTAITRKEEPSSLLEAIRQHPLMRNDRFTSNEIGQNSTVACPFQETNTKHGLQKVPPPIPPPPKPKTNKNEVLEGAVNRDPTPVRSTPLPQKLDEHVIAPDTEVKSLRLIKSAKQDFSKANALKVQAESKTEKYTTNQLIQKAAQRHMTSPQALKTHQQKDDVAPNALKPGTDSKANRNIKYKCITPANFRNPTQKLRSESHPTQVFHLDGATIDQSYSDDHVRDGNHQIQKPADPESTHPEPIFRFDVSTGRLLLSDATLDQSCTESDVLSLLPPPPMMDFTSEPKFSERRWLDNHDSSGNRRLESSNCISFPFIDRNISMENDSVFLEGIGSPPPPAFFIDPDENSEMKSKHESRSNPLAMLAFRSPDAHPKADKESIPRRFGTGTNPPQVVDQETILRRFGLGTNPPQVADPTSVPLPPPEYQIVPDVAHRLNKHSLPPEPPSKNQWGQPSGVARRQIPSEGSVGDWSSSDVSDWLHQIGLGQHASSFTSHRVDGQRLTSMTRRELIELGVTEMTDRRDIERGVIRLKSLAST